MLIQFTKPDGLHFYIRSEDLRELEDYFPLGSGEQVGAPPVPHTRARWERDGATIERDVQGSAQENYTRLAELERSATQEYERRQLMQRMGQLPPAAPVARGKPR
jgi:hypothetical protein